MLLLPLGGCFSAMSHFMGASPSTGEAIGCATLDVVTMPVQAAVIGPFVLKECIDANTGERGRAKRRQEEIGRYAAALIKNRNFPPDLVRLSYDEPLLTEFRICYVRHHWRPDGTKRNELELQKFTQECDALKHDCEKGKISFDASSTRRFELTKKYLSAECPDDWDKFIIP